MTWRVFRFAWLPLSCRIYCVYLPILVLNVAAAFVLHNDGIVPMLVIGVSIPFNLLLIPFIAFVMRRCTSWQVSEVGLRFATPWYLHTLTWDEVECVRRPYPLPIYHAGALKRGHFPRRIAFAPPLVDDYPGFATAISHLAPENHVMRKFAESPGEYYPETK